MDALASVRDRVAGIIAERQTGEIMLARSTIAASEPETPWIPGEAVRDVFALQGRADGVTADMIDGTVVTATDLVVVVSPKARHTMTGDEEADGAIVDIVPTATDTLEIDGQEKTIKRVVALPAAGPAAMFQIFVAS